MQDVYDGYARDEGTRRRWSRANAGNRAIRDELVAAVLPLVPAAGVVLDVGCGNGWWLGRVADAGTPHDRLAGVDIQAARIDAARTRLPGADLRTGDVRALPHADGSVAAATLLTVLSSLGSDADRRAALREVRRVVAPGGVVVVWEPRLPTGNPATARVPRRLLRDELGPIDVRSLTLLPPLARRLPGAAYPALARIPALRSHRVVVAQV